MYPMSLERMAHGLQGAPLEPAAGELDAVSTDTRKLKPGAVFAALPGARTDGHRFLGEALRAGASALVVERIGPRERRLARARSAGVVRVKAVLPALQSLAADQRRLFQHPVAAVTGSNGKTGTKDLLARLLALKGPVLATQGNFNNHLGLPLTLLAAEPAQRSAVLELGMNHAGELAFLAALARPQVGVVTNVGSAHLAHFGSRARLAAAKAELVQGLGSGGAAALNGDDPRVRAMARLRPGLRCLSFGRSAACQLRALDIDDRGAGGLGARIILADTAAGVRAAARLRLGRGGVPALMNALAAMAAGHLMGLGLKAMAAALDGAVPGGRMRLEQAPLPGSVECLLDCYNASPESMDAAFGYLARSAGPAPRLAALGSMLELGGAAPALHRAVGAAAKASGIRALAALGPQAPALCEGFGAGSAAFSEGTPALAAAWLKERLTPGAWLLVKGSRGMRMERVYDLLSGC